MASIADRLINNLVGGVLNRSATNVTSAAPIRNSRAKEFSNSDPFAKPSKPNFLTPVAPSAAVPNTSAELCLTTSPPNDPDDCAFILNIIKWYTFTKMVLKNN